MLFGRNSQPKKNPRIGEVLVRFGFITPQQRDEAIALQQKLKAEGKNALLGQILVEKHFLSQRQLKLGLLLSSMMTCHFSFASDQDTHYHTQNLWGLDRIDQSGQTLDHTYHYQQAGAGVHVYVIDSGIDATQPEFEGRIGNGIDLVNNDNDPNDCSGHGTHVAGIIGSHTFGVAKAVTLHAVRVLDCNEDGNANNFIRGINWVVDNHVKPAVINLSAGIDMSKLTNSQVNAVKKSFDKALERARAAGITVVTAAGNDAQDACNVAPAYNSEAIVVGAIDDKDQVAPFSNTGQCVTLFAPGTDILSVLKGQQGGTFSSSGTSMATPFVTGTVATYLETHPDTTPDEIKDKLIQHANQNAIEDSEGSPNLVLNTISDSDSQS